jgi:hypothetical protein
MKQDKLACPGAPPTMWALARLAVLVAASVGLTIALAAADASDRVPYAIAIGSAAAAAALLAVAARRWLRWTAWLLIGLGFTLAAVLSGPVDSLAVLLLLASFIPLSVSVVSDLAVVESHHRGSLFDERRLAGAEADEEIAAELNRARRYERPLTVATLSVAPERMGPLAARRVIHEVTRSLAGCLRQSDVVRQRDPLRLVLVLPETDAGDADILLERVCGSLRGRALETVRVGAAAFPTEEVTWVGLERRALARERLIGRPPFFRRAGLAEHDLAPRERGRVTSPSGREAAVG